MSDETTTIVQLLLRERQGRDREWWPQMTAAFWPDSQVNLTWYTGDGPGFVAGSEAMSGRGDRSVHRLAPPVVHLAGARAWAEVPAAIEVRTTVDDVPVDLTSYARLGYRVERGDGEWRILSLDAIYERDTVAPVLPGSVPPIPAEELAAFRPSCALLPGTWTGAATGSAPACSATTGPPSGTPTTSRSSTGCTPERLSRFCC